MGLNWLRSIQLRVLAVVLFAALAAGAIAIRVTLGVMTDLAEVGMVEDTIERTEHARTLIADRLAVARAELTSAALLAEVDRTSAVSTVLSDFVRAARVERDGESLELVRDDHARRALGVAVRGGAGVLADGYVVVAVDVGGAAAVGVVTVESLLPAGPTRSARIEAATDPRLGVANVIVERRGGDDGEHAVALALIGDQLAVRHDASLAGARAEIDGEMRRVIGWGVAATAVLVLLLSWMLSRRVTRPVRALAAAVRAGGGGELVLPPLSDDEIGELGKAIASAHGALAHDARLLSVSARFARDALRTSEPAAVKRHLDEALRAAHPDQEWQVQTGDDALAALRTAGVAPQSSWTRAGTEGIAAPMVIDLGGKLVVQGDTGGASSFVALGSGNASADDRRSIETLCRTAVAALKNLELARAAAVNDKLALVGKLSASVAHEINNPLAYVTLNLNLLEEELKGRELEIVREIQGGVQRVTRIVADLSRLYRGGGDTIAREDLVALVADQIKVARVRLGTSELVVAPSPPAWVRCGRGRVGQSVLNLVVNAIDATAAQPGGRVEVSFHRDDGSWVVRVRDNGPGIPAAAQRQLFDAFFSTKGEHGTGLGLYLSREFIRSQGGALELVETGAGGTTFQLSLPADSDEAPSVHGLQSSAGSSRPCVLVIDDEPAILRTMQRALARFAEVKTAASGPKASLLRVRSLARWSCVTGTCRT